MTIDRIQKKYFYISLGIFILIVSLLVSIRLSSQKKVFVDAILNSNNLTAENTIGNNYIEDMTPSDIFKTSNGKLYIADSVGNRILIYNAEPVGATTHPDIVLGQQNQIFTIGGTSSSTLMSPQGVTVDDTKVYVADTGNNRILIWNSLPTSSGTPANTVLGHSTFDTSTANDGGISAHSLSAPTSIWVSGNKLFVADSGNNRVLIWNTIPTINNTPADVVIGQPNMTENTANNGGIERNTLHTPYDVTSDGTHVFIADKDNHRVLIFASIPGIDHADADIVLGQPDFTSSTANNGGISPSSLSLPIAARYDGSRLFVSEYGNERVKIYSSLPTNTNEAATTIVGQTNATSIVTSVVSSIYTGRGRPFSDGSKLYLADEKNHRTLLFETIPTSDGASSTKVLGQHSYTTNELIDGSTIFRSPGTAVNGVLTLTHKLFLYSPSYTNRVLMFDALPLNDRGVASRVIGYTSLFEKNPGGALSANSIFTSERTTLSGVGSNGDKLAVADPAANRVLFWNSLPSSDGQSADYVLGQSIFTTGTPSTTSATSLQEVEAIDMQRCTLTMADTTNNRVLVYQLPITQNQQAANQVLGQPDFLTSSPNTGGVSSSSLQGPKGVSSSFHKLFIADTENNRVLVYNSFPSTSNVAADFVLGQPNMTSTDANNVSLPSRARLNAPYSVAYDGSRLYVADHLNNRVLIWTSPITHNGQDADYVLGQADFDSIGQNPDPLKSIPAPMSVSYAYGKLLVTTSDFSRVFDIGSTLFDSPPEEISMTIEQSTLLLRAHPSIQAGHDTSAHTTVTVQSSALNGYRIYGSLDDGHGNARLSGYNGIIPAGTGTNSFGYEAKNEEYQANEVVQADGTFASTPTALNSNSFPIGGSAPTCGAKHTVYYDLHVDYETPAGVYNGQITYTAVGTF